MDTAIAWTIPEMARSEFRRTRSVTSVIARAIDSLLSEQQAEPRVVEINLDESLPASAIAQQGIRRAMEWKEVGASTVRVSQAEKSLLEKVYTFRDGVEVMGVIEKYPFLASLLINAYEKVLSYFPAPQLFLDVISDPEASDDRRLALYIATNLTPREAVEKLEQFDEDWWLDAIDGARGKLIIDVEV